MASRVALGVRTVVLLSWFFYAYPSDATIWRAAKDYVKRGPFDRLVDCEMIADDMETASRYRWLVLRPKGLEGYACFPGADAEGDAVSQADRGR